MARSAVTEKQVRPRPQVTVVLTVSAVASAATPRKKPRPRPPEASSMTMASRPEANALAVWATWSRCKAVIVPKPSSRSASDRLAVDLVNSAGKNILAKAPRQCRAYMACEPARLYASGPVERADREARFPSGHPALYGNQNTGGRG